MIEIPFIYAKKCDKCKSMRQAIKSISMFYEVEDKIKLVEYNCDDEEAIDIAIKYSIGDIPGCSIEGVVIDGEDYNREDIVKAIKKIAE